MKFIFRQFEVPLILRNFLEQHVPTPPVIDLGLTVEFNLRACLYEGGLARVPGLVRFAEISPLQKNSVALLIMFYLVFI